MSSFRHPSRLFDPFTSESAPLLDLPVQLWYKEPSSLCEPEAPCVQGCPNTDDGFTWDWFLHMIAQGDKCFSARAAACRRHCTVSVDNSMRQKVKLFLSYKTFICCPLAPYSPNLPTSVLSSPASPEFVSGTKTFQIIEKKRTYIKITTPLGVVAQSRVSRALIFRDLMF